jgi:hypothetical protein
MEAGASRDVAARAVPAPGQVDILVNNAGGSRRRPSISSGRFHSTEPMP